MDIAAKKEYKTGIKWSLWSGILALTCVSGIVAYRFLPKGSMAPVSVSVLTVKLDTVETTINESGTVELGGQQTLKSPDESAVEQIRVKLGDRVARNQELLTLRNPERQTILNENQLKIQQQEVAVVRNQEKVVEAQESLEAAKQDWKNQRYNRDLKLQTEMAKKDLALQEQEQTLIRNRQKVVEAQEEVEAARQKLQQSEALLERGFIAGQELDQQKDAVRLAQKNLRDAQLILDNDLIKLQKLKVDKLIDLPSMGNPIPKAESDLREAKSQLRTSISLLQQSKLEYQKKQQELLDSMIAASIEGIVLKIHVKAGDGVTRGADLLTLGDPNQELIKLQLSTLNATNVMPGQEARVIVLGPDSQPFMGRVQSLELQAGNQGNSQQGDSSSQSGEATVPATVRLDKPTKTLIPGSLVNVEIVLKQRKNVVALNLEAIQSMESHPFVWIKDSQGLAQKQPVTLGLEGLTTVEVKSGLKPGDKILLPPAEVKLEPGMPVMIEDPQPKETPGKPEKS